MNKNKTEITIILIHKGADNLSLPFVLKQVKFFNPKCRIILIGDKTNKKYGKYVDHFLIKDYMGEGLLLRKYYKHFSPNPYDFELFCLQRWFILFNFLERNKIEHCFYMDSDVMVYSDLSKEAINFFQYDLTVNNEFFGHCMFINNSNALKIFCDFILKTYQEKSLLEIKLEFSDYLKMVKKLNGGISDMAFINKYYETHKNTIGETGGITNDSVFDNNVNESGGFRIDSSLITRGIKKIFMTDGIPYGMHKKMFKKIRFNVIHFQGPAKKYIPFFSSQKDFHFFISFLLLSIKFYFKKNINFMEKNFKKIKNAIKILGVDGLISFIHAIIQINFLKIRKINSNSQLYEDYLMEKILGKISTGFYLDIGANNPDRLNNTKYFYDKGWNGINIEPNPLLHKEFLEKRKRDNNLCIGIGLQEGEMDFYSFKENVLSTFSSKEADKRKKDGFEIDKIFKVRTDTLKNVLASNLPKNIKLNFMSVDTEGFDIDVLKSNDWDIYRPEIICIETNEFGKTEISRDREVINFLKSKNYKEIFFNGINSIFIDKKV